MGRSRDQERVQGQGQKLVERDLEKAFQIASKQERNNKVGEAKAKAVAELITAE